MRTIVDLYDQVRAMAQHRDAFKKGDILGVLPIYQPDYILRKMEVDPLYGSVPIGDQATFIQKGFASWHAQSRKVCLPVLDEALDGDTAAQEYYRSHRLISYSLAPDWQKAVVQDIAARLIGKEALTKKFGDSIEWRYAKKDTSTRRLTAEATLDWYGTIATAEKVIGALEAQAAEVTYGDLTPVQKIGVLVHPAQMTLTGKATRQFVKEATDALFLATLFTDTLRLMEISLPESMRARVFGACGFRMPWDLKDERSPLLRIKQFEEIASTRHPDRSPWELGIGIEQVLNAKNPEKLFGASTEGRIGITPTHPTSHAEIRGRDSSLPELRDSQHDMLIEGLEEALSHDELSRKARHDLAVRFAKLINSYGEAYGADYLDILRAIVEGHDSGLPPQKIYEEVEKNCRAVYRQVNRTGSECTYPEELATVQKPGEVVKVFVRHPDLESDLLGMTSVDRAFAETKIAQINGGAVFQPKTITLDGQKETFSIVAHKLRRANGLSLRIYARRIGTHESVILGACLKNDNIFAETEIIGGMLARAATFLDERAEQKEKVAQN